MNFENFRTILFLRNNPKKTVFQNINKRQSIRQFHAIFFKNCGFPKNSELPSFLPSFLPFKKKIYIYNTPIKEGKIKSKKKTREQCKNRNPQSAIVSKQSKLAKFPPSPRKNPRISRTVWEQLFHSPSWTLVIAILRRKNDRMGTEFGINSRRKRVFDGQGRSTCWRESRI